MKRAYLMEMNVLRGYATSLLATGFLVTVLVGVGMKTAIVAPAVLTSMCFMMGAIGSSVYDDQNGWGSYRLTLPVSKRDVVLSRYAAIATLGLIGSAVGFAASLAVMGRPSFCQPSPSACSWSPPCFSGTRGFSEAARSGSWRTSSRPSRPPLGSRPRWRRCSRPRF